MPDRPPQSATAWLADQVATNRLERVTASMSAAGDLINEARRHAASAAKIADDDPVLGIGACHDAARKAITAHLRADGYRVTSAAGAHRIVVEYAEVALPGVVSQDDLNDLDFLRRDRHTAEYGDFASRTITPDRVHDAIALANRITNAVAATLAAKNPPNEGPKGPTNKRFR